MRRSLLAALPSLLALSTSSSPSLAQAPSRALLLLPSCPLDGVSEPDLRAALALELSADGVALSAPGNGFGRSDVLLEIQSTCEPDTDLTLRALFRDRARTRALSLGDLPPRNRSRLLALSLAELVDRLEPEGDEPAAMPDTESAGSAEPTTPPQPVRPAEPARGDEPAASQPASTPAADAPAAHPAESPAVPRVPAPPPAAVSREPPAVGVDTTPRGSLESKLPAVALVPELRWFTSGSALFGARLLLDTTRWNAGLGVLGGRSSSELGSLEAVLLQSFAGYRLFYEQLGPGLSLSLGPRVGFGWIEVSGTPLDSGVEMTAADAPYLDAGAFGDLRWAVSRTFRCSLSAEAGVSRGLTALAGGQPSATYDGPYFAGLVGIMVAP